MSDPMQILIEQLDAAGARRRGEPGEWPAEAEFAGVLAVLQQDHRPSAVADESGVDAEPLAAVSEIFGLDEVDAALLWCAAAGDLDANVGIAFAALRGAPGQARPTVALALELAGLPTATAEPFVRLGLDGPLRRHGLIEVSTSEPWLARQLSVPDSVAAVLAGGVPADPSVDRLRMTLVPLAVAGSEVIARGMERGLPLIWVRSAAGMSGTAMAAGAFDQLGLNFLAIDLRRHQPDQSVGELTACAARNAGLRGWGLVLVGCEVVAESAERGVFEALERAAVPVVAVSTKPWNPLWSARFPLVVEAGPLSVEDRSGTWKESLGDVVDANDDLHDTLLGLRLSAEDIGEAARYAHVLAAARGQDVTSDLVRESARRVGGSGAHTSDRVMGMPGAGTGPRFSDLVLPDHVTGTLRQLVSWSRHRDSVAAEGMLRGRGRGIAALFTGSPGTGKTLAAHVIAEELSIELFQVDLSSVVDKYIGETEKNLERVFQAAEALDVVLFFDEADALFGSRSEVQDARDRYANQEVSYLLQRMEHFDGITILSTNLRGNLDRAFSRRMSFIVHFPDPDAPTRARLWEHHLAQLPALDADDPVAVESLSQAVEFAGGDIRNIVLAAAYDAVAADEEVGHRHVMAATIAEYRKLGRVVPDLSHVGSAEEVAESVRTHRRRDRLDARGRQLDHQPGCRREAGSGPVHDRQRVELAWPHRDPPRLRCQPRQQLLGGPLGDHRVGQAHADQLDGGLDVLDLDPGLGVAAGLVQHPAQDGAGRVVRAPRRLGHHQRGVGQALGGHRGGQPLRIGTDVDELVAGDRLDLHAFTVDAGDRDHRGLESAAAQILLDVAGVLPDQLDPDAGVSSQHVRDQARTGVQPRGAEHAEPDRPGLQLRDVLHGSSGVLRGGECALGVRSQGLREAGRHDAPAHPVEQGGAEGLFEVADLLGDRGLRVAQLVGGSSDRSPLVRREEAAQLVQ